ncbi:hypothetical protein [Amycolatopsis arida]|uniref:hypothetical protein n=1 Tax=Amycolatopsis arida TaxID=587909 RepID=UPI001FB9FB2B|nr:hypothetical protein [Amycolatopsis arida]
MPNDFVPRVGHRFTLRSVPIGPVDFSGVVACEVLELVPPRAVEHQLGRRRGCRLVQHHRHLEPPTGGPGHQDGA